MLRATAVPQKVVILDCCWSGKALKGATMGADDLAAIAAVKGTAVLTACASTAKALSPAGEDCTAFTGALTQILYEGIRGGPANSTSQPFSKAWTVGSAARTGLVRSSPPRDSARASCWR